MQLGLACDPIWLIVKFVGLGNAQLLTCSAIDGKKPIFDTIANSESETISLPHGCSWLSNLRQATNHHSATTTDLKANLEAQAAAWDNLTLQHIQASASEPKHE